MSLQFEIRQNAESSYISSFIPFLLQLDVCFGPGHITDPVPFFLSSMIKLLKCASLLNSCQEGEDRQEEDTDADSVERRHKLQQLRDELRALRQQRAEVGTPREENGRGRVWRIFLCITPSASWILT